MLLDLRVSARVLTIRCVIVYTVDHEESRMMEDLGDIIDILEAENIVLQVRYLKSARNPSDWYSRVRDTSEWMLRP
eukprot:SAG11_NODE_24711_length_369_cov_0.929630_2_plen_75_part_01